MGVNIHKYTTVTQLHENLNNDIIEYFNKTVDVNSIAFRRTFHKIKNNPNINISKLNTEIQKEYKVTKRTASSIIIDAKGRFLAIKELKKFELKTIVQKIEHLETIVIPKLKEKLTNNILKINSGKSIDLIKHRNLRRSIVAKKSKLNRLRQKKSNIEYQLETERFKLCFGTRKLAKKNKEQFLAQRDSNMHYIGCKSEVARNQNFKLSYNKKNNQFKVRIRKDFRDTTSDKYVYGQIYFRHHKNKLVEFLKTGNSPLSYRIIKRNDRYYLHCTFQIQYDKEEFLTRNSYGTIGIDFNKDFVTIAETNECGHLINTDLIHYRFKQGNSTQTDFEKIANILVDLALKSGKDIVIENLDFKNKKANTETKRGRKYNEMIHSLAYRRFANIVENIAYKNKVWVRKVNPAWTSWIAKTKFCPHMKLNIHVGASYVIARRGQYFKD